MADGKKEQTLSFSKIEEEVLKFWEEKNIFQKSLENRKRNKHFVFYEGPPYANGKPGIHHVLARAFKDIIARYKTMRGYYVPRRAGWDTHGLPTEIAAEKRLGIKSKREIEERVGVAKFVEAAREDVFLYKNEWERMTRRMGYWLDLDNPYITMTNDYIESLWWIIAQIDKKGFLYEEDKILPWCTRCGTALSSHELAQGYKSKTDISLYIKFPVVGEAKTFFLVWTTTPWTLSGNVALAFNAKANYVTIEIEGKEHLILTETRASTLFPNAKIVAKTPGKHFENMQYQPLYAIALSDEEKKLSYRVVSADFVSTEDGTGIVHIAPAFGEDDYILGKKQNLPILRTVNEEGKFKEIVSQWKGLSIWDANPKIIENIKMRELLFKEEIIEHEYPHCWRCDSPIIYFAKKSWWIRMSALREELQVANDVVSWHPNHLKDGRFGEWIRDAKDWAFSRERYWGTPLPVWKCETCSAHRTIGSFKELRMGAVTSNNRYIMMRHGEATANVANIVADNIERDNSVLTEKGRKQVTSTITALKIKKIKPDLLFTSPFARAKETAEILADAFHLRLDEIKVDPRLSEIKTGIFSGKSSSEYHAFFSDYMEKFTKRPPDGETLEEVAKRVLEAIDEIEARYHNKTIMIVAHEYSLWMLWAVANGCAHEEAVHEQKRKKYEFLKTAGWQELHYQALPRDTSGRLDVHKPFIDAVRIKCLTCGGNMKRVPDVVDVWFDSGAMPFASPHFPFAFGKPDFKKLEFPADYICEGIDQTRGWFYTLLAVSVLLGQSTPYKHVVSLELILDEKGKKMSKSKGNIEDPWALFAEYGADAVRWYFFTINQPWDPKLFSSRDVAETVRRFFIIVWNSFQFWKLYGSQGVASAKRIAGRVGPKLLVNQWMRARLSELVASVTEKLDRYDIVGAARDIEYFAVEDLSRWYIRRIRGLMRGDSGAYQETDDTLQLALIEMSKLIAPFTPFVADELYRSLGGKDESVHVADWPKLKKCGKQEIALIDRMKHTRGIVALALEARAKAGIRVRQPLQTLTIKEKSGEIPKAFCEIIADEVNVKKILFDRGITDEVVLDTMISHGLRKEGIVRDLVRKVQQKRKEAGFTQGKNVDLVIVAPKEIIDAVETMNKSFSRDVGARSLSLTEGKNIAISFH